MVEPCVEEFDGTCPECGGEVYTLSEQIFRGAEWNSRLRCKGCDNIFKTKSTEIIVRK